MQENTLDRPGPGGILSGLHARTKIGLAFRKPPPSSSLEGVSDPGWEWVTEGDRHFASDGHLARLIPSLRLLENWNVLQKTTLTLMARGGL